MELIMFLNYPSVQYKVTKTRINNGNQININSKSDFKVYINCV